MDPQKPNFLHRAWRIVRIPLAVIAVLYIGLVIYRIPAVLEKAKTKEVVDKIHAQKLTLKDVTGDNLPPTPDPALVDATVAGVDANANGIRDDVELAIFKLHPDSARIRAAELQYAMDLQSESILVFNSDTWSAAVKYEGGIGCLVEVAFDKYTNTRDQIGKSDEWRKEVDGLSFNTSARILRKAEIKKYETTVVTGTKDCDVSIKDLPN